MQMSDAATPDGAWFAFVLVRPFLWLPDHRLFAYEMRKRFTGGF
jgi:hypothetical protein